MAQSVLTTNSTSSFAESNVTDYESATLPAYVYYMDYVLGKLKQIYYQVLKLVNISCNKVILVKVLIIIFLLLLLLSLLLILLPLLLNKYFFLRNRADACHQNQASLTSKNMFD